MLPSKNYYYEPQTDEDFIQIALDYLGAAIRDNSREDKIAFGKMIHTGDWDEEEEEERKKTHLTLVR